eukprot:TRINITY_DN6396_c2_g1_i2.p1 TRINITY_DN6396_c2_g1~~TRINITY_DN6396_c2_g1_i2.p1  ORF type:complete len:621 (-),score=136.23 TRINITY_DN6396_c2_g1_i2:917-2512(-)
MAEQMQSQFEAQKLDLARQQMELRDALWAEMKQAVNKQLHQQQQQQHQQPTSPHEEHQPQQPMRQPQQHVYQQQQQQQQPVYQQQQQLVHQTPTRRRGRPTSGPQQVLHSPQRKSSYMSSTKDPSLVSHFPPDARFSAEDAANTVWVGNLPAKTVDHRWLGAIFADCGNVLRSEVCRPSQIFGWVMFSTADAVTKAIQQYHGALFGDRIIRVEPADKPRSDEPVFAAATSRKRSISIERAGTLERAEQIREQYFITQPRRSQRRQFQPVANHGSVPRPALGRPQRKRPAFARNNFADEHNANATPLAVPRPMLDRPQRKRAAAAAAVVNDFADDFDAPTEPAAPTRPVKKAHFAENAVQSFDFAGVGHYAPAAPQISSGPLSFQKYQQQHPPQTSSTTRTIPPPKPRQSKSAANNVAASSSAIPAFAPKRHNPLAWRKGGFVKPNRDGRGDVVDPRGAVELKEIRVVEEEDTKEDSEYEDDEAEDESAVALTELTWALNPVSRTRERYRETYQDDENYDDGADDEDLDEES